MLSKDIYNQVFEAPAGVSKVLIFCVMWFLYVFSSSTSQIYKLRSIIEYIEICCLLLNAAIVVVC